MKRGFRERSVADAMELGLADLHRVEAEKRKEETDNEARLVERARRREENRVAAEIVVDSMLDVESLLAGKL